MEDLQSLVFDVFLVLILAVYQLIEDELVFFSGQLEGLNRVMLTLR